MLTASRLAEIMVYDQVSGHFTRRVGCKGHAAGKVVGAVRPTGARKQLSYRVIRIDGRDYYAHRLAWLYIHGQWPSTDIDHINSDADDNRMSNLRLATMSQNIANSRRRSDNSSGYKGVCFDKRARKWRAEITVRGKQKYLGLHETPELAHAAYVDAAKAAFGIFARLA